MSGIGNEVQIRVVAEQVASAAAEAAYLRFTASHPAPPKVEVPPVVKWLAGALGALGTAAMISICFWVVTTLNDLALTVTRMDERQRSSVTAAQLAETTARITRLEQFHHLPPTPAMKDGG